MYTWFLGCHKACVVIGIVGYGLLILEGLGLGLLLGSMWPDGISLMLVWYGLYFGVLGRDLAEVAGDRMVSNPCKQHRHCRSIATVLLTWPERKFAIRHILAL